jgi:hypothetical protein
MPTLYDLIGEMGAKKADEVDRYLKSISPGARSGFDGYGPGAAIPVGAQTPAVSPQPIQPQTASAATISVAPPLAPVDAVGPGLNRMAAQKDGAPTPQPAVSNAGGDLNGTLSYLGNRPAYQAIAKRGAVANLSAQGYRPLELPGSSPNSLPTGVMKQQGQGVKGSSLPELQAQYAKQGIAFDPNAMYEQMNYAVPGAKGTASGWRKVDPNRPQGSFSVTPALSETDQQRYNQIVANETRQREYAQGRGPQWDATQAAQANQAVAVLKQMREQAKDQRDYGLQQAAQDETKIKNRMDAEFNAARLEQSIAAARNKAMRVDPKMIPTVASIIEAEQKNAPLTSKLTSNQHLSNGLSKYGIKTATDMQKPPDGLFVSPDDPTQVFMRDPKTNMVTPLGSVEDYLKQWATKLYSGISVQPETFVTPSQP